MNPLAQSIGREDFPPMAEVRQTLTIPWYRCPIDRAKLQALNERSDMRGFLHAIGHFGLWVLTGVVSFYFYTQSIWWALLAALFAHGTVGSFFTAPHHELGHRTVFKTRWLNDFFVNIFSLFGWLNYRIYQFSHNYHHRFTLFLEGDREEVMPVTPSLRALYILQLFTINITGGYQSRGIIPTVKNMILIAMNRFDRPFNSWGPELYQGHAKERMQAVWWARIVLAFHTAVVVLSLAAGEPIIALIVSGSPFIANWLRYFVGVPMHCGLRSNVPDFRKCVRTITLDPISEFLYWHMNWHLEHHMFAAVPCYNLKALHREVADDMPAPRTLTGAWREMRETWRRQKTDPKYAYDTPVPEKKSDLKDDASGGSLAESVGDFDPTAATRESFKHWRAKHTMTDKIIYTWNAVPAVRNLTITELREGKGKQVFTQVTANTEDEAAAALEAGIDMIIGNHKNVEAVRRANPKTFLTAAVPLPEAVTTGDVLRTAFRAMELGADQVMTEISKRTGLITVSLGSGTGGDVAYLFMEDICGEKPEAPRHARAFGNLHGLYEQIKTERVESLRRFKEASLDKTFPAESETAGIDEGEFEKFLTQLEQSD